MLVGISESAVSLAFGDGVLTKGETGIQWLHAYCARLRGQASGRMGQDVGGLDLVQERAALAREQRHGIEIKNAVLRGEFAAIGVLSEVLATASQSVVERFEQLPGILKKSCPELSESARDQVMAVIANARNEWVRATEQLVSKKLTEYEEEPDDE